MSCDQCSREYIEEFYCDQCKKEHKLCFICYETLIWDNEINRVIWCYEHDKYDNKKFRDKLIQCCECNQEKRYGWGGGCFRCGYCDNFVCMNCLKIYHFKGKCILQGGKSTKAAKEN